LVPCPDAGTIATGSIVRKIPSLESSTSNTWQMCGWLTLAAARASRQNRDRVVSSGRPAIIFRATSRPSRSSRAKYTTPMPPRPSRRITT
jgi:hypothetical protein